MRSASVAVVVLTALMVAAWGSARPAATPRYDRVVLQECVGREAFVFPPVPGISDRLLGAEVGGADVDLPLVVAFGDTLRQARARLQLGVRAAKDSFGVTRVTAHGQDGTVVWAVIGGMKEYAGVNPAALRAAEAQLTAQAKALVARCITESKNAASRTTPATPWRLTKLVTPHGWSECSARLINERDQVVGYCTVTEAGGGTAASHAFLWSGGKATDLGDFISLAINVRGEVIGVRDRAVPAATSDRTVATSAFLWKEGRLINLSVSGVPFTNLAAINDRGQIVGTIKSKKGAVRGFLWQDGKMIDLGARSPRAINNRGEILGTIETKNGVRAFVWRDARVTNLSTLGGDGVEPVAINDRGQVVGTSYTKAGKQHAFLWQRGRMTDIGPFTPIAINEHGQVVGSSYTSKGHQRSLLWENGRTTDLGTLGGPDAGAVAINNRGEIVGMSTTATGASHAFVWENGKMFDLPTLGGLSRSAAGIDNTSRVIGSSETAGARSHAVVWILRHPQP